MRILVFSDTHLGRSFDQRKFNFLKKIIENADRVIINGDFWEGYEMSFDKFVKSKWKNLFPLLLKKKAVYIFGNHDKKSFADRRVLRFSIKQVQQYRLQLKDKTFVFEHGHRLSPFWDEKLPGRRNPFLINLILNKLEWLLFRLFKKNFLKYAYKRFNDVIKRIRASDFDKDVYLVCGHTSWAEIDEKGRYLNSGFVKYGLGQYLMIDDGKPRAHEEWY